MPIYEYECTHCGHRLEKLQKISDAPLVTCPDCDHDALTKLISAAGFRLKGGGWYETDFKKDGKKNLAGDGGSSKSDSGSGSDSGGSASSESSSKSDSGGSSSGTSSSTAAA